MYTDQHADHMKTLYHHYTCATDTENIRRIFVDVKDIVMRINLEYLNLH